MAKIKIAKLGEGDVFLGEAEIEEEAFDPAAQVLASEYGGGCDNAPGRYRWNRAAKRFEPLHHEQEAFARDMQRIVEFAAEQGLEHPEIGPIVKKHFPAEHRAARLKKGGA
jgi:hypothetical protein